MRFLSVAERELRAAARRKSTYRWRWIAALGFFGLLLWLAWVFDLFGNRNNASSVFQGFAVCIYAFSLLIGATGTADSLSREKREGTLGLLFLTNLNSTEIVAGKLCAHALSAIYCLLAIFPILALPLMVGGITFDEFLRVVLAEIVALFFAIAMGFVASAICVRQFPAVALAMGLVIFFGLILMGAAEAVRALGLPRAYANWVADFCALKPLTLAAFGRRTIQLPDYWWSLVSVAVMSAGALALVAWGLRHSWRDRPKKARPTNPLKFGAQWRQRGSAAKLAFRRRLLEINPFFWLAGRQRVSAPLFMGIVVLITLVTSFVAAPYFGRVMGGGTARLVMGLLFSWLWAGLAIHLSVFFYAAAAASRQLAEDKQSGVLELILSTPASEPVIARGLWLAYARKMLFPALVAILTHAYFTWVLVTLMVLDPPGRLPRNVTAGEVFWCGLLGQPLRGQILDWQFGFMLHSVLLLLIGIVATWVMLGWVGRWLGLRMKHPGFAPLAAVTLAIAPPALIFSLFCFLADRWHFFRLPERQVIPLMMWIAFGIVLVNCLVLSAWAAGNLRANFRATVIGRFSNSPQRWWRPDWPRLRRRALQFAAGVLVLGLIGVGFYAWQNAHARRAWAVFQQELKQQGVSLDVTPYLPTPVPDAENFARSPAFLTLRNQMRTNSNVRPLLDQLRDAQLLNNLYSTPLGTDWTHYRPLPLTNFVRWMNPKARLGNATNSAAVAGAILQALEPHAGWLQSVSEAARRPALQFTTDRVAAQLITANNEETSLLERLHMLLQIRASAALSAGDPAAAAEDLRTGLRLANLARQLPDARASVRVQILVARCLQPLWEGLAARRWNADQLASLQHDLAGFNLLADHTNAVRRVTLFYIETWRNQPDASQWMQGTTVGPRITRGPRPGFEPAAWQYYNCMQLHTAAAHALASVDVVRGHVTENVNWSDTSGLPLDADTIYFLQQGAWWGARSAMVSFAQTSLNQAVVACALERHRLAHGKFPESLEELVPALLDRLPPDTQRGRPLLYQLVSPDQFILRGVGQDGADDRLSSASDDWLWAYSTNAPARVK